MNQYIKKINIKDINIYISPRLGDRKHTTRLIKIIYHRKSWEILFITCFTKYFVNPNFFCKNCDCEPHNTLFTTRQQRNAWKKVPWGLTNRHSFSNIFYEFMTNNWNNIKCFKFISPHPSTELIIYFFILRQSTV